MNVSKQGILVEIFRGSSDCTNGGVTSTKHGSRGALLLGVPDGNYTEEDARPRGDVVLRVERRNYQGEEYIVAVPVGVEGRTMFGGNFVYTSDSRYRRGVCEYPIPVHDRVE